MVCGGVHTASTCDVRTDRRRVQVRQRSENVSDPEGPIVGCDGAGRVENLIVDWRHALLYTCISEGCRAVVRGDYRMTNPVMN